MRRCSVLLPALLALALLAAGHPSAVPAAPVDEPPATATAPVRAYLPNLRQGLVYGGSVKFAVIGDYGACAAERADGCVAEAAVAAMVKRWQPDFIVTTGDNNYPNGETATFWENLRFYAEYIPTNFEPAAGNHDYPCDECPEPFIQLFQRPLTRQFARPGRDNPLVRFFIIDSNAADDEDPKGLGRKAARINPLPEQRQWLEQATHLPACWRIVALHHPPYASGGRHGNHPEVSSAYGWRYRDWGVDVVLAGHEHNYERILRPNGFAYIITGTGGDELDPRPKGTPVLGSVAQVYGHYGALRGYADPTRLELTFVSTDPFAAQPNEQVEDTHVMQRDCAGGP
jgi:tartrate-resistant acid phosphatase type 5